MVLLKAVFKGSREDLLSRVLDRSPDYSSLLTV